MGRGGRKKVGDLPQTWSQCSDCGCVSAPGGGAGAPADLEAADRVQHEDNADIQSGKFLPLGKQRCEGARRAWTSFEVKDVSMNVHMLVVLRFQIYRELLKMSIKAKKRMIALRDSVGTDVATYRRVPSRGGRG